MPKFSGVGAGSIDLDNFDFNSIEPVSGAEYTEKDYTPISKKQEKNIISGYDDIDVTIPRGSNMILLCGITQSGKSNLLMYMLSRPENIIFDNYVIFCLSSEQELYKGFPKSCIKECSLESIENEIMIQDKLYKATGKTACFIFDDLIGSVSMHQNPAIDRLSISSRHSGVVSIVLSQQVTKISPTQRSNAAKIWITTVKGNLDPLAEMQFEDKKSFIKRISMTFDDKYSIKCIDLFNKSKMKIFKVPEMKKTVKFIL